MCVHLYIAADHRLPTMEGSKPDARFFVRRLELWEDPVRRHFGRRHVFFVGSHLGCGCGFEDDPDTSSHPTLRAHQDEEAADDARRRLHSYLHSATEFGPVELYCCAPGEVMTAPEFHVVGHLADLRAPGFTLQAGEKKTFRR